MEADAGPCVSAGTYLPVPDMKSVFSSGVQSHAFVRQTPPWTVSSKPRLGLTSLDDHLCQQPVSLVPRRMYSFLDVIEAVKL